MTSLSIIIVSFNARRHLEACLTSLHEPHPAIDHEIIVVDNASADGSALAARRWPEVRVIESRSNVGFAAANNLGIRQSTGGCLLLLNSDTLVPAGALDRLIDVARRRPDAAVIGPRLVDDRGRAELSFGAMLSPLTEFKRKRLGRRLAAGDPAAVRCVDDLTRREQWTDWVSGACLLVRRPAAEAAGLLDERFFMYTEDVDFCATIRSQGGRVLFTPELEIVHLGGRSRASAPQATHAAYRRSHLAFYEKHHPWAVRLLRLYTRFRDRPLAR
jgi:N-acetylglucosaminyl-diphospho-decaprenol L-rhamnosyltransferase